MCGTIGHEESSCEAPTATDPLKYGPWLRYDPVNDIQPRKVTHTILRVNFGSPATANRQIATSSRLTGVSIRDVPTDKPGDKSSIALRPIQIGQDELIWL